MVTDGYRYSAGASVSTMTIFPLPARQTGRTEFLARLSFEITPSLTRTALLQTPAGQAVGRLQPLVRGAHVFRTPQLALPTQPLARPLACMHVDGHVGQPHLPQTKVVRPTEQRLVQASQNHALDGPR